MIIEFLWFKYSIYLSKYHIKKGTYITSLGYPYRKVLELPESIIALRKMIKLRQAKKINNNERNKLNKSILLVVKLSNDSVFIFGQLATDISKCICRKNRTYISSTLLV